MWYAYFNILPLSTDLLNFTVYLVSTNIRTGIPAIITKRNMSTFHSLQEIKLFE
jgi:hypothetical protein